MGRPFDQLRHYVRAHMSDAPARFDDWRTTSFPWWRAPQPAPQPPAIAPVAEPPRRIGLVLGGGGGKGGAHLGVLAVLEELEVPIDLLVGTSIGGAVGLMYAAGIDLATIAQVFRASTLRRIATADPTRTGFIGARKREALLVEWLGSRTFADLRFPCAVVATDLVSGREVVIDNGPLVPALLATTALPGVFPPLMRGSEVLADGGILNNLPVDVAVRLGATRTVAVQLVADDEEFELPQPASENPLSRLSLAPRQFAIANRALGLLIAKTTALRLERCPPTILLHPEVSRIGMLDMNRPEDGRVAGAVAARAASRQLQELREWRAQAPAAPAPAPTPAPPAPASLERQQGAGPGTPLALSWADPLPELRRSLERWRQSAVDGIARLRE